MVPDKDSVILDEETGLYKLAENVNYVNDTITEILTEENLALFFNNNERTAVSFHQPIFTISDNEQIVKLSQDIVVGDKIVKVDENGVITTETVESVSYIDEPITTYHIKLQNHHCFVAEGILINQ